MTRGVEEFFADLVGEFDDGYEVDDAEPETH